MESSKDKRGTTEERGGRDHSEQASASTVMAPSGRETSSEKQSESVAATAPTVAPGTDASAPEARDDVEQADTQLSSPDAASAPTLAGPTGASRSDAGWKTARQEQTLASSDRYHVTDEVARGGLGRILLAEDRWLGRNVAVKELKSPNRGAAARFRREALITARLQHPAIVPVYDANHWDSGHPFYSMRMVPGRSLDRAIRESRSLDERMALLPNLRTVADAIAYAHSNGIIHRDLKPANVMVGEFGETVVIDWGLAKDLEADEEEDEPLPPAAFSDGAEGGLTVTGAVLGTPAYMPPEQAQGKEVDQRSDVYALGAILYHLLCGKPPYKGTNSQSILTSVLAGPPRRIADREPAAPRDLVVIAEKAMARDPAKRYPSAAQLAEDLRRFETGQLISVREYSLATLLGRWVVRHRAAVAVGGVALVVMAAMGTIALRRIVKERSVAVAERARAEDRANEVTLLQARTSLEDDPTAAMAWLKKVVVNDENIAAVRDVAQLALARGVASTVMQAEGQRILTGVTFSPDGSLLAAGWAGETILLRDTKNDTNRLLEGNEGPVISLTFSRDGAQLASAHEDGAIVLWDLTTGKPETLGRLTAMAGHVAFSNDGKWLAGAGDEPRVLIWDLATRERREINASETMVVGISISPDSQTIASAGADGSVRLSNLATGEQRILGSHRGGASMVEFSPDGRLLASVGTDAELRLWSVADGSCRVLRGHEQSVNGAVFSPDGRYVATSSQDATVRLWEVESGEPRVFRGHAGQTFYLAFDREGTTLASSSVDGTVRVWDLSSGDSQVLSGHEGMVTAVAFSSRGLLASVGQAGWLRIWRPRRKAGRLLLRHRARVSNIDLSADGRFFASAGGDGDIGLVRLDAEPVEARLLKGHEAEVWDVTFTPDSTTLLSASKDHTARRWELPSGASQILHRHAGSMIRQVEVSPDGQLAAFVNDDGSVWLRRLQSGSGRALETGSVRAVVARFSPDGHTLVAGGTGGAVLAWRLPATEPTRLEGSRDPITALRYSPDGGLLVACTDSGQVLAWAPQDGHGSVLPGDCQPYSDFAFSPDGGQLAFPSRDFSVRVMDRGTGESRILRGHTALVWRVAFSPDRHRLASCSEDGTVRIWDVSDGTSRLLAGHTGKVARVAFTADGTTVLSAGHDGEIRLWRDDAGAQLPREPAALQQWLATATSAHIDEAGLLTSL